MLREQHALAGGPLGPAASGAAPVLPSLQRTRMLTLDALFSRMARARPAAVAVQDGPARLCYGEAEARAARLATMLVRDGVQLGDPVIVHCADHRQALVAQLAVLKAGGVCTPVPPLADESVLRAAVAVSGAQAVLCSTGTREPWLVDGPVLALDSAELDERLRLLRSDPSLPRSDPMDAAHLVIGRPDGPVPGSGRLVDHRAWQYCIAARTRRLGVPDRVLAPRQDPLSARALSAMWWAVAGGATLHTCGRWADVVRARGRGAREVAVLSPEEYAAVLAEPHDGERGPGPATVVLVGGPCPADLAERHFALLPGSRLWAEFAPHDGLLPWTNREITAGRRDAGPALLGIGGPVPNVRVQVLGSDGTAVPHGRVGELCAAGSALPFDSVHPLGAGPASPAAGALLRSSWLGRWRADGTLELTSPCPASDKRWR